MRTRILLFLGWFFIPLIAFGQEGELQNAIRKLEKMFIETESYDGLYRYQLKAHPEKSYEVVIEETQDGKKGTSLTQYQVNLADLDTKVMGWRPKKEVVEMTLKTSQRQKFIGVTVDGVRENYTHEIVLFIYSPENARLIRNQVRECSELAVQVFNEEITIESLKTGFDWLQQNLNHQSASDGASEQMLHRPDQSQSILEVKVNGPDHFFGQRVNLSDLRSATVRLEVDGKSVSISAETEQRHKYVYREKDGEQENYGKVLDLQVRSIEQGRFARQVLKKTIHLAKEQQREQTTIITSIEEGAELLKGLAEIGEEQNKHTRQVFSGFCSCELRVEEGDASKNGGQGFWRFEFADLDHRSIKLHISGKTVSVKGKPLYKQPLIQHFREEELEKYVREISFLANDIEVAKMIEDVLIQMVSICRKSRVFSIADSATATQALDWIVKHIPNVTIGDTEYNQKVSCQESSDPCQLTFTQKETSSKKEMRELFEFTVSDMDDRKIDYAINGKELAIAVGATAKNKYVKHYENEEIAKYVSGFQIYLDDLALARNMIQAWKVLVKNCRK